MAQRGQKFDADFAALVLADTDFLVRGRTIGSILDSYKVSRPTYQNWKRRLKWDENLYNLYQIKRKEIEKNVQNEQELITLPTPPPSAKDLRPSIIQVLQECQDWVKNNLHKLPGELPESYVAVAQVMQVVAEYLQTERALDIADEYARNTRQPVALALEQEREADFEALN